MIPRTVLVALEPFGEELSAARAAAAIGRGLQAGDPSLEIDLCPIEEDGSGARDRPGRENRPGEGNESGGGHGPGGGSGPGRGNRPSGGHGRGGGDEPGRGGGPGDVRGLLDALDLDARLHRARAVVVGARRLDERTLLGSATFELATRARQGGVPAYAVAVENALSLFDARMMDLQTILEARDAEGLRRAGKRLAELV